MLRKKKQTKQKKLEHSQQSVQPAERRTATAIGRRSEKGGGGECLECYKHLCLIRNQMRNFPGSGAFKQCAEGLQEARMDVTLGEGFRQRKQLEQRQEGNYLQLPRCFLTAETKT